MLGFGLQGPGFGRVAQHIRHTLLDFHCAEFEISDASAQVSRL